MAVELLNCLALRKLLFINILSSDVLFLKCLIQWKSKLIWISLQTELLMRREDLLLFNIERLKFEDRAKKGVSQCTNNILSTCCHLMHWLISERKCLHFLNKWRPHRGCSFQISSTTDPKSHCQYQHPSFVIWTPWQYRY